MYGRDGFFCFCFFWDRLLRSRDCFFLGGTLRFFGSGVVIFDLLWFSGHLLFLLLFAPLTEQLHPFNVVHLCCFMQLIFRCRWILFLSWRLKDSSIHFKGCFIHFINLCCPLSVTLFQAGYLSCPLSVCQSISIQ